jgi:hypothetical protein
MSNKPHQPAPTPPKPPSVADKYVTPGGQPVAPVTTAAPSAAPTADKYVSPAGGAPKPPAPPAPEPTAGKRVLTWTAMGERAGAFSEHGRAEAGVKFETDTPDIYLTRDWAE